MTENLNKIKVVPAELCGTNKWPTDQLEIYQTAVSKCCTNTTQPYLYMPVNWLLLLVLILLAC